VPPDSIDAGETATCNCRSSIISSAAPDRKLDCVLDASVHRCVEELTLLTKNDENELSGETQGNTALNTPLLEHDPTATAAVC